MRIRVIQQFLLNELIWFSTWKLDHIKWRHFPRIWYANWINQKLVLTQPKIYPNIFSCFIIEDTSQVVSYSTITSRNPKWNKNSSTRGQTSWYLYFETAVSKLVAHPTPYTYLDTVVIIMHVTIGCHIKRRLRVFM